jgi:hypothetical protein
MREKVRCIVMAAVRVIRVIRPEEETEGCNAGHWRWPVYLHLDARLAGQAGGKLGVHNTVPG